MHEGHQRPEVALDNASGKLLHRLAASWGHRAQVKKEEFDVHASVDDGRPDFRIDLLPFKEHPRFVSASDNVKRQILSCGWIAYNQKTIDVETKIVGPASESILYRELPGLQDSVSRQIASETLVDEAYHVLLVNTAIQVTRDENGFHALTLPVSNLVKKMWKTQEQYAESWQKTLVQLATAIVSEVFISDYLRVLSRDESIKPLNRATVEAHWRDELVHGSIFRALAKSMYAALDEKEREFFLSVLPKPVHWFANLELDAWKTMLEFIDFSHTEEVINDCKSVHEENLSRLDYSGVVTLVQDLGGDAAQRGIQEFYTEGLMN